MSFFLGVFCYIFWVDSQSHHLLSKVCVCAFKSLFVSECHCVCWQTVFTAWVLPTFAICQCPCSAPPKESRQSDDQKQQTPLEHSGANTNYTLTCGPICAKHCNALTPPAHWHSATVKSSATRERAQMINANDWMVLMSHWWVLMTMTVIMQAWWQQNKRRWWQPQHQWR